MTVSADGKEDAPIEVEILSKTNTTGKFCVSGLVLQRIYSLNEIGCNYSITSVGQL